MIWLGIVMVAALAVCHFIMDSMLTFYIAAVLLLAVVAVNGIMKYRGNALGCDGKVMLVRDGGMRSVTHLIRVDAVQSVASTTGIFQRRRKVANYHVDFHAPVMRNIASVNHMSDDILHELDKYILK